jgi:hypothetical protein
MICVRKTVSKLHIAISDTYDCLKPHRTIDGATIHTVMSVCDDNDGGFAERHIAKLREKVGQFSDTYSPGILDAGRNAIANHLR